MAVPVSTTKGSLAQRITANKGARSRRGGPRRGGLVIPHRRRLDVLHLGQQHSTVGHQTPPRLEDHLQAALGNRLRQPLHPLRNRVSGRLRNVRRGAGNLRRKPAPQVDMLHADAQLLAQLVGERQEAISRLNKRLQLVNVRAEVAADALDLQAGARLRAAVDGHRLADRYAKLVPAAACENVRVGEAFPRKGKGLAYEKFPKLTKKSRLKNGLKLTIQIQLRINSNGDVLHLIMATGHRLNSIQLLPALHVDTLNISFDGHRQLLHRLAAAAEDDLRGVDAGGEAAGNLTARNDVKAGAQLVEEVEEGEVWVRLHGVAQHKVLDVLQRAEVEAVVVDEAVGVVDVQGRAVLFGQLLEDDAA